MKNIIKKISIIVIALFLLSTVATTFVYAQDLLPNVNRVPDVQEVPTNVTDMIGTIATIIQVIGVAISVIVIILLGIKYMVGSVDERADYKKAMLPFLVGAILITATSTIVKIISNLTSQVIEQ